MSPYPKTGYGNPVFYAVCNSEASARHKEIILDDYIRYVNNTNIYIGTPIFVQFTKGNIHSFPLLDIYDENNNRNETISDYNIVSYKDTEGSIETIKPYSIAILIYDGGDWQALNY